MAFLMRNISLHPLMVDADLDLVKNKLKSYSSSQVVFSDHSVQSLLLRDGSKDEVLDNLLKPDRLVYYYIERGRHVLFFALSNTRTLKLPVVLAKKHLYIVTYIKTFKPWQDLVRERYGK